MAQFSTLKNKLLNNNNTIYEVVMLAGQAGPSIYVPAGNLNASTDAFGRLRVAEPYTLFDSSNILEENELFDTQLIGGASKTHVPSRSAVDLTVETAGDAIVRQSFRRFSYQPGKSLLILNTFCFASQQTGLTQRAGYYDTLNGAYLEYTDGVTYLALRSQNLTDRIIPQSEWNVDKLDGTGPTGVILDPEKTHIWWCDIEWLGVGSVRMGFVINGQFICCHVFHNANIQTEVYMTTPNLPITYEISTTENLAAPASMQQICSSVLSEGGYDARAMEHIIGNNIANPNDTLTANVWVNLVTIQAKQTGEIIIPAGIDILNLDNANIEWALFKNATPTTPFTWDGTYNAVEYSTQEVNLDMNNLGRRVAGGFIASKTAPASLGELNWDYQLGYFIDGTSETYTLAVRGASTNISCAGILKWYEP